MEPDIIIKYLFQDYEPYLTRIDAASRRCWGELLFPNKPETLDFNTFNRFKEAKKKTPDIVLNVLADEDVRAKIEKKLQIAGLGLFQVSDYGTLDGILRSHLDEGVKECAMLSRALIIPEPLPNQESCIALSEDDAIRLICDKLSESSGNPICWEDAPRVGTMFIAYAMGGTYLPKIGIKQSYLLCPYAGYDVEMSSDEKDEVPFDRALEELRVHLRLPKDSSEFKLLQALNGLDSVLIVVHPELLHEKGASSLGRLLKIIETHDELTTTNIVLLGQANFKVGNCRPFRFSLKQEESSESLDFLELQWKRYCEFRGYSPADEQGTRLNRARDYYASEKALKTTLATRPATLRMLAFLASNYGTFSYFDPTAGWDELADMLAAQLPVEIRLHIDEVNSLLRSSKDKNVMFAVEWCSTALYWLTTDAVKVLLRLQNMKLKTFENAISKEYGKLITIDKVLPQTGGRTDKVPEVYKMDLATRALVQDRWVRRDPYGRACAHYAIAKWLFEHCNDKTMLHSEFPYEPHWGRSRMFFLAECVRHLIRSCAPKWPEHAQKRVTEMEFPDPPTELPGGAGGCDPREIMNFCFYRLFWQELNGNWQSDHMVTRKLARQHGAYELTGELLELMSLRRQLGEPHIALDTNYHERYYREVAFAQLDVGLLEEALRSANKLVILTNKRVEAKSEQVAHQLDRVIILTAMNRIDEAERELVAVEQIVKTLEKLSAYTATRLKARHAQIQYFRGDFAGALQTYESLAKEDPSAIARDVAHFYIATLGAIGRTDYLQRALTICLQSLFLNSSLGQHHEALGFRVALAHTLRKNKMLDAAEATLDQVLYDIRKFGCAERTYLSFLLEAGRIVSNYPERVPRAYAAYLRPCLDRAFSFGYVRTARIAMNCVDDCLNQLLARFKSFPDLSPEDIRRMLMDERAPTPVSHELEVDPRYGFGQTQVEAWLLRLATPSAIENELNELDSIRTKLKSSTGQ